METAVAPSKAFDLETSLLQNWVQTWIRTCTEFRRWERENRILKHPAPAIVAEHGRLIKTLIWSARMLQAMMADPEHPSREFKSEVEGLLGQLEATSEMIHNPMADEECDALLEKYFPDAPRN